MSSSKHKPKKTKTYSSSKGIAWLYSEVCALLDAWAEPEIQRQLSGRLHNMCVYEKISERLQELDIDRNAEQCREKIKKLKRDYKIVTDNNYAPAFARKVLGCYDKVHEVFSRCSINFSNSLDNLPHNNNDTDPEKAGEYSLQSSTDDSIVPDSDSDKSIVNKDEIDVIQWPQDIMRPTNTAIEALSKTRMKLNARYLEIDSRRYARDIEREKARLRLLEIRRDQGHQRSQRLFRSLLSLVDKHRFLNGNRAVSSS